MGHSKEDWERAHFHDEMYLREKEFEEQEHYYYQEQQQKPAIVMGDTEMAKCDFCHETKSVTRTYLYPSRYKKPTTPEGRQALYNEGDYFTYVKTCIDCGEPVKHKELIK